MPIWSMTFSGSGPQGRGCAPFGNSSKDAWCRMKFANAYAVGRVAARFVGFSPGHDRGRAGRRWPHVSGYAAGGTAIGPGYRVPNAAGKVPPPAGDDPIHHRTNAALRSHHGVSLGIEAAWLVEPVCGAVYHVRVRARHTRWEVRPGTLYTPSHQDRLGRRATYGAGAGHHLSPGTRRIHAARGPVGTGRTDNARHVATGGVNAADREFADQPYGGVKLEGDPPRSATTLDPAAARYR
jgi:hypothetical protein